MTRCVCVKDASHLLPRARVIGTAHRDSANACQILICDPASHCNLPRPRVGAARTSLLQRFEVKHQRAVNACGLVCDQPDIKRPDAVGLSCGADNGPAGAAFDQHFGDFRNRTPCKRFGLVVDEERHATAWDQRVDLGIGDIHRGRVRLARPKPVERVETRLVYRGAACQRDGCEDQKLAHGRFLRLWYLRRNRLRSR
jgi:hypothetical protein